MMKKLLNNKKGMEIEAMGKLLLWLFILLVVLGVIVLIQQKLSGSADMFRFMGF